MARGRLRLVFSLPAVGRSASSDRSRFESKIFAAVPRRPGERCAAQRSGADLRGGCKGSGGTHPLAGPDGRPAHAPASADELGSPGDAGARIQVHNHGNAGRSQAGGRFRRLGAWGWLGQALWDCRSYAACKPGKCAQSGSCGDSVSTAGPAMLTSPVWGRRYGPGGDARRPARRLRTARRLAADRPRNPRHARVEELNSRRTDRTTARATGGAASSRMTR